MKLPGESTLRDYSGFFQCTQGFQGHVLEDLRAKAGKLDERDKFVCILHDEMKIARDLVFAERRTPR